MKPLYIALLSLFIFYAAPVWAYTCVTSTASTTINIPSVSIQRDMPIGSQIGSEVASGTVNPFTCTNSAPGATYQEFGIKGYGNFNSMINGRRVYDTNIQGVGYTIGVNMVSACAGGVWYVSGDNNLDGNPNNIGMCAVNGLFGLPITAQARVTFYKTASITGTGTVNAKQIGSFILRSNQSAFQYPESTVNISSFNITTLACSVSNASINVPMGSVKTTDFNGIGSSPANANTQNFNIPLSCNPGTKVNVTLDGTAINNAAGVIALDSAGSSGMASGVGVQLLYNNAPVSLGRPINIGTTVINGAYNIPLQARYYQTSSPISAGKANSSATFTLTYQ